MSKDLVSITELSKHLGVSVNTINHWASRGKIPCVRMHPGKRFFNVARVKSALLEGDAKDRGFRGKE